MKIWELLMMAAANAGGGAGPSVADLFSVDLWTGNAQNGRTITTGLDMSGDGGLVWLRRRNAVRDHFLHDSERTLTRALRSNSNNGELTPSGGLQSFTPNGFTVGTGDANGNGDPFVAWSFKKAAGFFDVVAYDGNGVSGRTVPHNLGSVPGMIMIKSLFARDWAVYHRGVDATAPEDFRLRLNNNSARQNASSFLNDTAPTSTEFTLGTEIDVNASEQPARVAYLFAHNPTGGIQCGSYIGNGSNQTIDLGWDTQFVMIKRVDATGSWGMWDAQRFTGAFRQALFADTSAAETATSAPSFVANGFSVSGLDYNNSGGRYIYMAIRAE